MRKPFSILAIAMLLVACNSGNEGSDSVIIDSARVADSTWLEDSLRKLDAEFDIDQSYPAAGDTTTQ